MEHTFLKLKMIAEAFFQLTYYLTVGKVIKILILRISQLEL